MRRTLPSTRDLACFEAVVRNCSVTGAAQELNLTQSAVSRRITSLEGLLGEQLFMRDKQRLIPTQAAEAYAQELHRLLSGIEVATTRLLAHGRKGGGLTLACLPTFGSRWLMPRLGDFLAAHPGIDINLISKIRPFNFDQEPAHAAIHFGQPLWADARIHFLMNEHVVPVCVPTLLPDGPLKKPDELRKMTLIQHTTRPNLWQDWLRHVEAQGVNGLAGPKFEYYSLVIDAALAGIGVALLPDFLVKKEIASGQLAIAYDQAMCCGDAYYVVYPHKYETNQNVLSFVDWILIQAADHSAAADPHPAP